jgi:Flp pilus assembly pilin Flp
MGQYATNAMIWILLRARGERGQDLIEYALLGGVIAGALLAVAVLTGLTTGVTAMANGIGECIDWDNVDCV